MSFADLIVSGFNNIIDTIFNGFSHLIDFIGEPLAYLLSYLKDTIYLFEQLFTVAILIIKIFVAILQFFGAIVAGLIRTISGMLNPSFHSSMNYPSNSYDGLQIFLNIADNMGLLTIVPGIILAVLWIIFAFKVIGLFGGRI